jgi:hypothetical protein
LLYLPPYCPDLNPIEQVFAKFKALLRTAAARTIDVRWATIGRLLDRFPPTECTNYLVNSGYPQPRCSVLRAAHCWWLRKAAAPGRGPSLHATSPPPTLVQSGNLNFEIWSSGGCRFFLPRSSFALVDFRGGEPERRLDGRRGLGFAVSALLTFCHRNPPLTEARGCEPGRLHYAHPFDSAMRRFESSPVSQRVRSPGCYFPGGVESPIFS